MTNTNTTSTGVGELLPYDITIGHVTFQKGVELETLVNAARRWFEIASNAGKPTWQPIETAPRDGTRFLATHVKSGVVAVTWHGKTSHVPLYGWCEGEDPEDVDLWSPTHWMPLPAPPALQSGAQP